MEILIASGNAGKSGKFENWEPIWTGIGWGWILSMAMRAPRRRGPVLWTMPFSKAVAGILYSGRITIGEDSGLCVDALDGTGYFFRSVRRVHGDNARNNQTLLKALEGIPLDERGAHYTCATAVAFRAEWLKAECPVPEGSRILRENPFLPSGIWAWVTEGEVHGRIATEETGEGGFGYDPLFFYPPFGTTFAESAPEEKHRVSHRAAAMGRLFDWFGGSPLSAG